MKLRALFVFFLLTLVVPAVAAAQSGSTSTQTQAKPKPVCVITAKPASVYVGDTVMLSWNSQNATEGTITSLGTVGPAGSQGVIPTAYTSIYVGVFNGPGGTSNCSVTVGILQGSGGSNPGAPADSGGVAPSASGQVTSGTGLIPCKGTDCQACHLAGLAQNIINWLVGISIPLAAAMFAWAGIMYFTSGIETDWNKKNDAKKIFKNVGIGFVIVITAWLGIQTILKTVLSPGFYQSWNEIKCVDNSQRPTTKTIQDVLALLPGLNTLVPAAIPTPPVGNQNYGGAINPQTGCTEGDYLSGGSCMNAFGGTYSPGSASSGGYVSPSEYNTCYEGDQLYDGYCQGDDEEYEPFARSNSRTGPEGTCQAGYRYIEDNEYAWCEGPNGADDIADFQAPGQGGGPVVRCALDQPGCADIASAIDAAKGNLSSRGVPGTGDGNLACAWAVNNVLQKSGIAPIDGLSVASMATQLDNGRGEPVSPSQAGKGDIIVWQGVGNNGRPVSHVGFCENSGCSVTASNSSGAAQFQTNPYGQVLNGVQGRVYRVNK